MRSLIGFVSENRDALTDSRERKFFLSFLLTDAEQRQRRQSVLAVVLVLVIFRRPVVRRVRIRFGILHKSETEKIKKSFQKINQSEKIICAFPRTIVRGATVVLYLYRTGAHIRQHRSFRLFCISYDLRAERFSTRA